MITREKQSRTHSIITGAALWTLSVTLVAAALHWAWNGAVVDVFGLSGLSFRNSLGLVLTASLVIGGASHLLTGRSGCRKGGDDAERNAFS